MKFSMPLLSLLAVGFMSLFGGIKAPQISSDIVSVNLGSVSTIPNVRYSFWETALGFPFSTIANVFSACSDPEIFQSIIQRIEIPVIDLVPSRYFDIVKRQDNSMSPEYSVIPHVGYSNGDSGRSFVFIARYFPGHLSGKAIAEVGFAFSSCEVMARPDLPDQVPSFRFVKKTLAKVFDGWENQARLHAAVSVWSLESRERTKRLRLSPFNNQIHT